MLLLDLFQAVRSEETGGISAVSSIVVIQRKSISSHTKDPGANMLQSLLAEVFESSVTCFSIAGP